MSKRMFGVGVSSALALACAAYATPRETVTFHNVVTESTLGGPGNSVITNGFTGSYTVTKLRLNGTLNSTSTGTWPDDSHILVQTPSGQTIDLHPFTQTGGFTSISTPGDLVITLPTPEPAAGTWTFTFYESYDDAGTDAYWEPVTFTLDDEAPAPPPPPATFQEAEPNDFKGQATNANGIAAGQTIGGLSMGNTTNPGNTSIDYFKVKTQTAPLAIYRHRLVFTSNGPAVATASIRGLSQFNGVINTGSDVAVQTASTATTPPSTLQWYGFGKQEEIYVAVAGSTSTSAEYRGTYERTTITPISAGSFFAGDITIDRDPSNTVDADFLVYDGNFNALPGYSNDGGNILTRNYAPGTYYIAFSNYNTCNDQAAPADDTYPSENVMDFANSVVCNSTTLYPNMNIRITDFSGNPVTVTGSKDGFFDVVWYQMTVANPSGPIPPRGTGTATPSSVAITGSTLLKVTAIAGFNPASTGMQVHADLSAFHGGSNQSFYDDGTHGDEAAGDNVFSYLATLAEPMSPGSYTVPFTVSDAQGRSGTGNIAVTATSAPTGGCCVTGECQTMTAYACAQGGGTYSGNGTSCSIGNSSNAFSSIAGTGIMLGTVSNCDDCVEGLTIPFNFNFYGTDYNFLSVSSNGNVQFTGTSTEYFNGIIPGAGAPNNAIYPMWDDLNPATAGDIYYQVVGTSPNQTLTIEWAGVSQYTAGGTYPVTNENFQVVLHEGSNDIEFRYGTITPARTDNIQNGTGIGPGGDDYTVGIEDPTGTTASWVPGTSLGAGNVSLLLNSNHSVVSCGGSCPGNECGPQDYNGDGDSGTDQDIEAFFACLGGNCCATCFCQASDFNGDGDFGTDQDIEAFFRVLGGAGC